MKRILCPIDFSESSMNALAYASELGKFFHAELYIFHAVHFTSQGIDESVVMPSPQVEYENICLKRIDGIAETLRKSGNGEVKFYSLVKTGLLGDEIFATTKSYQIDIIILGTKAPHGSLNIFNGMTSGIAINAPCPVLVIPGNAKFKEPQEIIYATDLREKDENMILEIVDFAEVFNAHISFLNIQKIEHENPEKMISYGLSILDSSNYKNMSFHVLEKQNVVKGINDFALKHKADMLVMSHYERSFIDKILTKSITKEELYSPSLPVLALHKAIKEKSGELLQ